MDQTLNMKLRFVTAVMVGSSTGDVLAFFREQVWPHILQAVPPSPQLHQHWLDGLFGLNREMVLKWSNTIAGWQTRHAGAMCPHRLPLPPWSVDTAPSYAEILEDPWAVWGLAAMRYCDK